MLMPKRAENKKVMFSLQASDAKEVMLAGDFNNWDHRSMPLRRAGSNLWKRDLVLKSGRYEYKFVIDGSWINDPSNNNRVTNAFGTENSVIEI